MKFAKRVVKSLWITSYLHTLGTSPNPHIIGGEEEDKNLISQENFDKTMYDDEYSLIVEKR